MIKTLPDSTYFSIMSIKVTVGQSRTRMKRNSCLLAYLLMTHNNEGSSTLKDWSDESSVFQSGSSSDTWIEPLSSKFPLINLPFPYFRCPKKIIRLSGRVSLLFQPFSADSEQSAYILLVLGCTSLLLCLEHA